MAFLSYEITTESYVPLTYTTESYVHNHILRQVRIPAWQDDLRTYMPLTETAARGFRGPDQRRVAFHSDFVCEGYHFCYFVRGVRLFFFYFHSSSRRRIVFRDDFTNTILSFISYKKITRYFSQKTC